MLCLLRAVQATGMYNLLLASKATKPAETFVSVAPQQASQLPN
jgi:hypothetical protein